MITASLVAAPRTIAICLPSWDHSRCETPSSLKLLSCWAGPPDKGCNQRLVVSPRPSTYVTARPSGVQRGPELQCRVDGRGKVLSGVPPENGNTRMTVLPVSTSLEKQATNFPSGEMSGSVAKRSVNCVGSPPPMGTFQSISLPDL